MDPFRKESAYIRILPVLSLRHLNHKEVLIGRKRHYRKTAFVHTDEVLKLMSLLTDDDRYELTLTSEGGKPKNMCEMLDRVEARGMAKGMEKGRAEGRTEGEDMVITLLKKLTPGSEDYYKALNASPENCIKSTESLNSL